MAETLEIELETLKYTVMSNGYPLDFIKHHRQPRRRIVAELSAPKLEIDIHLVVNGSWGELV